jgi:hypothetical protein
MQIKLTNGLSFSEADIVNKDSTSLDHLNGVHLYIIHDHGFTVGVALADDYDEAFDALADAGKLDAFLIDDNDTDYNDEDGTYLGNESRRFDIDALRFFSLPCPTISLTASIHDDKAFDNFIVR